MEVKRAYVEDKEGNVYTYINGLTTIYFKNGGHQLLKSLKDKPQIIKAIEKR